MSSVYITVIIVFIIIELSTRCSSSSSSTSNNNNNNDNDNIVLIKITSSNHYNGNAYHAHDKYNINNSAIISFSVLDTARLIITTILLVFRY